jgi:hypothetical protein
MPYLDLAEHHTAMRCFLVNTNCMASFGTNSQHFRQGLHRNYVRALKMHTICYSSQYER